MVISIILSATASLVIAGETLYVGGIPGDYNNIQAAITATQDGDTIIVRDGVYTGQGNLNITTVGKDITIRSENGPENCTIDCEKQDRAFNFQSGVDENTIIDGFTIADGDNEGILLNGGVLVKNCIIENNGRGITSLTTSSVVHVEDTVIRNNVTTGSGAAIYFNNGGPHTITGSVISNNETTGAGGGVFIQNSGLGLTIEDTMISNNTSATGSGIYCTKTRMDINKTTINSNTSSGNGGGLYMKENSLVTMTNSNIIDNIAGTPFALRATQDNPFALQEDQFFVCGDNSPASLDARLWKTPGKGNRLPDDTRGEYRMGTVPRDYLVGKAFFVYWPGPYRPFNDTKLARTLEKKPGIRLAKMLLNVPYIDGMKIIYGGSSKNAD